MKSTGVLAWQQRVVGTGYGAQVEAARLLNAPPQSYRNWLEGRTTPSGPVQRLMRYVEKFGKLEDDDD